MMTVSEYLKNPCGTLPLPYFKYKSQNPDKDVKCVHDDDFEESMLSDYSGERYFRLLHRLEKVEFPISDKYYLKTAVFEDIPKIVEIVNLSYSDIKTTVEEFTSLTLTETYDGDLWVLALDCKDNEVIGCGIADYDRMLNEGYLEWIQVLPEKRGNKIGTLIVNELLKRLQRKASFATVCGRADSDSNPEKLYRNCGFTGSDIWHILKKRTAEDNKEKKDGVSEEDI